MRFVRLLAPALAGALVLAPGPRRPALEVARINDNRVAAGTLRSGTLDLVLEIAPTAWHPVGPDQPSVQVLAFREAGKEATIPGPLVRVPLGAAVRARVTNTSDETLVVRGLSSRQTPVLDSLLLAPGASGTAEFAADVAGTFFYWGSAPGEDHDANLYERSQLSGAFIVDAPGAPTDDRIFILGSWVDGKLANGEPNFDRFVGTINGRPWPLTERLTYTMGDSIRWRIINISETVHPMHLHGFFFRVDARGDMQRDTVYWASQRRMAVTELVMPGQTMSVVWSPNRPGGWIYHCHLNWHLVSNPHMGDQALSKEDREKVILGESGHATDDPAHHVEKMMGGYIMGIYIKPSPDYVAPTGPRATQRLFIQSHTAQTDEGPLMRMGYVLQRGVEPAMDSVVSPGSTIILHQGEPSRIWVYNRTHEPSQVHWHGMEIESPFDGVIGVGGMEAKPTPPIMPGDSFEVRITPPRAGTFMYHTHVNDTHQMSRGLWGTLIVLPAGETYDPTHDHSFLLGESTQYAPILNGEQEHAPLKVMAGEPQRFRLANISMGGPALEYWLVREGAEVQWTPLAKDGYDLPAWQRRPTAARQRVSIGETYDFEVTFPAAGTYALEVRRSNRNLYTSQPIKVQAPIPTAAQQIAAAVLPLPEEMRAGATVLGYKVGGDLTELRKGNNGMICLADDPTPPAFHVACYQESMEPFMLRGRQLRKEGVTGEQVDTVRYKEVAEGKIKMPPMAALYSLSAAPGSWNPETNEVKEGRPLYVVYIPFATPETTGIPAAPAQGKPWLMFPGSPKAHIMFIPRM